MTKTPEQMAEEYADDWHKDCDYPAEILRHTKKATETVFLAGYQAGYAAGFESAMKIHDAVAEHVQKTESICAEVVQHEPLLASTKYQLADADKVMCNTTMEEIKAVDTGKITPITNLPTPAKWISVEDRLPEIPDTRFISEDVLWLTRYGEMEVSCLERLHSEFMVDWGDAGLLKLDQFTHWMPLPEPPKE